MLMLFKPVIQYFWNLCRLIVPLAHSSEPRGAPAPPPESGSASYGTKCNQRVCISYKPVRVIIFVLFAYLLVLYKFLQCCKLEEKKSKLERMIILIYCILPQGTRKINAFLSKKFVKGVGCDPWSLSKSSPFFLFISFIYTEKRDNFEIKNWPVNRPIFMSMERLIIFYSSYQGRKCFRISISTTNFP